MKLAYISVKYDYWSTNINILNFIYIFYAHEEFFGGILKSHRPSVRPSVRPSFFCVRAISLYCMNAFPYNLVEVFGISRRRVARKNHAPVSKVKVTQAVSVFICLLSCPGCNTLMYLYKDFKIIWHKCLAYQDVVSRESTTPYLKGQGHTFSLVVDNATIHVQSVILLCMEVF